MTEINKYLNELKLSLIFDDGKPGRVYVLNTEKTSIHFIIDVDDRCLYINQSILNVYPEKEIKAFLEEIGVVLYIFPYFEEPSDIEDLKPSTQQYFELLMMNTTSIKIDFNEYRNHIFLFNKNNNILQHDLKSDYIFSKNDEIWSKIHSENEYSYTKTQRIIKEMVEKHFKNRAMTPCSYALYNIISVDRHFKNVVTTPYNISEI